MNWIYNEDKPYVDPVTPAIANAASVETKVKLHAGQESTAEEAEATPVIKNAEATDPTPFSNLHLPFLSDE
jgi:hypothetical protein